MRDSNPSALLYLCISVQSKMEANLTTLKSTKSPDYNMLEPQYLYRHGAINLVIHFADTQNLLLIDHIFFSILSDKLPGVKVGQAHYTFPQRNPESMIFFFKCWKCPQLYKHPPYFSDKVVSCHPSCTSSYSWHPEGYKLQLLPYWAAQASIPATLKPVSSDSPTTLSCINS